MNEILEKFKTRDELEQIKMFQTLGDKLKLLQISKFVKNPSKVPHKIIQRIPMKNLIDVYNSAKTKELKSIIINDEFYQMAFIKTLNCSVSNTYIETDFFKDFDLILDTIYTNKNHRINSSKLSFINTYSNYLKFYTKDFKYIINDFFKIKNKEHNISIETMNKFSLKEVAYLYDMYSRLDDDTNQNNNSNPLYVKNIQDMENYLKRGFLERPDWIQDINYYFFNSMRMDLNRSDYIQNYYLMSESERKGLLKLYFKFNNLTEEDYETIFNYLKNQFQIEFSLEIWNFFKYKITKLIMSNPNRAVDLIRFNCFRSTSFYILLNFDFIEYEKYSYYNDVYLNNYNIPFLLKLNYQHLKKIYQILDNKIYGDETLYGFRIVLNMYLAFGYNKTIDILNGKYGTLSKNFFDNISKINIDTDNILDENNNLKLNQEYLNLLFNSEQNSNFSKIISSDDLIQLIYLIYNEYDIITKKYGKLTIKKCIDLLKDKQTIRVDSKNNLLLEQNLFDNIIKGNRRNVELVELMIKIEKNFTLQQERTTSSIPYLEGECDGYSYQTMRLNNPIVYNLGYLANCCFRITDIGEIDLKHATLDKNSRILLIYNELKELIAFSVLNRNGEVIIITSVEFDSLKEDIDHDKLRNTIIQFSNELYQTINSLNDRIKLITIGANSKIKPKDNIPFSSKYKTPKCAKEDEYQANSYHQQQHILLSDTNLNYNNLLYDIEVPTYKDPRLKIKKIIIDEFDLKYIRLIERIDNQKVDENILAIGDIFIFNEDFYILVKTNGEVISNIITRDERGILEYNSIKSGLEEYLKAESETVNILEDNVDL